MPILLTELGLGLSVLYLIHAEQIDEAALRTISERCPHLHTLGLYNCDFAERRGTGI